MRIKKQKTLLKFIFLCCAILGWGFLLIKTYKPPPPITLVVKLTGGMGNQLFKFAAAYSLSKSLDVPLYISVPEKKNADLKNPGTRTFVLDMFQVPLTPENIIAEAPSDGSVPVPQVYSNQNASYTLQSYSCHEIFDNRVHVSREYPVLLYSNDYCHSEEYFRPYKNDIIKMYQFSQQFISIAENSKVFHDWKEKIDFVNSNQGTSVAVHIRRGDYLQKGREYWVTPYSFYNEAIQLMTKKFCGKLLSFFIFSDDIEAVKENLDVNVACAGTIRFFFVSSSSSSELRMTSVEEFFLMRLCLHIIISNSTFSWWAAYLMDNEKKVVIGPTFHPQFLNHVKDSEEKAFKVAMWEYKYPPEWIVLDPYNGTGR